MLQGSLAVKVVKKPRKAAYRQYQGQHLHKLACSSAEDLQVLLGNITSCQEVKE